MDERNVRAAISEWIDFWKRDHAAMTPDRRTGLAVAAVILVATIARAII